MSVKGKRVERTRNAGTMTESMFFGMLRAALRQKSRWWKPISICKNKARRAYKGTNKRQKYEYQCNICKEWFKDTEVSVDHIIPCGRLASYEDLPGFVERLFVEEDMLQLLCEKCHLIKSKEDKWKTSHVQTEKEDGSEESLTSIEKTPPPPLPSKRKNYRSKKSKKTLKVCPKKSKKPIKG